MVNLVAAQKPILRALMKMAGVTQHTVEIEPGTQLSIWVPVELIKKSKNNSKLAQITFPTKPAVVLVHGFAAEGIVTWQFQVAALTKKYSVYIPDLLFFGGSVTDKPDRTTSFQADTLVKGLRKLGVEKCAVVGFSYGGVVTFKMAESCPNFVRGIVVSGAAWPMSDSITEATLKSLGVKSSSDLLLPTTVKGLKALLSMATSKKLWFPNCLYKDYLEVMFTNRKERSELLIDLVNDKDGTGLKSSMKVRLLWGKMDRLFDVGIAKDMKEKLGENATLQIIEKGGHLVHLERPVLYNKYLKHYLDSLHLEED